MLALLNTVAMVIGYIVLAYGSWWLFDQRRKQKWGQTLRGIDRDNAERW